MLGLRLEIGCVGRNETWGQRDDAEEGDAPMEYDALHVGQKWTSVVKWARWDKHV